MLVQVGCCQCIALRVPEVCEIIQDLRRFKMPGSEPLFEDMLRSYVQWLSFRVIPLLRVQVRQEHEGCCHIAMPLTQLLLADGERPQTEWFRLRAGATVVEEAGSHAIYVSKPEAVAALIEQAAKGVQAAAH